MPGVEKVVTDKFRVRAGNERMYHERRRIAACDIYLFACVWARTDRNEGNNTRFKRTPDYTSTQGAKQRHALNI